MNDKNEINLQKKTIDNERNKNFKKDNFKKIEILNIKKRNKPHPGSLYYNNKFSQLIDKIKEKKNDCINEVKNISELMKNYEKQTQKNQLQKKNRLIRNCSVGFFKLTKNKKAKNLNFSSNISNNISTIDNSYFSKSAINSPRKILKQKNNISSKLQSQNKHSNILEKSDFFPNENNLNDFKRIKNVKISYNKNWEVKNGFIPSKNYLFNLNHRIFQKKEIINEIDIIIDNMERFKNKILFKLREEINKGNVNVTFIQKLNMIIENTSSLFIKISHLILENFNKYLDDKEDNKFKEKKYELLNEEIINDELKQFDANINLLKQSYNYLVNCREHYEMLFSQIEDYKFSLNKMKKIKQYLFRARYGLSSIIFSSEKIISETQFENYLYAKYCINAEKLNQTLIKEYKNKIYGRNSKNMREKNRGLNNYNLERGLKIAKILANNMDKSSNEELKLDNLKRKAEIKNEKYLDYNNYLFNKILPYMKPDIKKFILNQKAIQNFSV